MIIYIYINVLWLYNIFCYMLYNIIYIAALFCYVTRVVHNIKYKIYVI